MNKKIAVDARMIDHSGIGVYLKQILARIMPSSGFQWVLIGNEGRLYELFGKYKPGIINCTAPIYSIREQFHLSLSIPAVDLFWSPHYVTPVFYRGRLVVTIHDVCPLALPEYFPGLLKQAYAHFMYRRSVNWAQVIITNSGFTSGELVKYTGVKNSKLRMIYHGVDEKFSANYPVEDIRIKYSLSRPYLLYVGNIKPHKNIVRLVRAYKLLTLKMDAPDLILAGKKEEFIFGINNLESIIKSENLKKKVRLIGHVIDDDLPVLYQQANLLVMPSLYEGFGFPPLEAMSAGCPVVSSRAGALPEICEDAAVYADPYSEESIASELQKVLTDEGLRTSLIQKGRVRAKQFSWDKTAQETMNVLNEVLNS